jgi:hypothetical protein
MPAMAEIFRATADLKYLAAIQFEEGLRMTVGWYRKQRLDLPQSIEARE